MALFGAAGGKFSLAESRPQATFGPSQAPQDCSRSHAMISLAFKRRLRHNFGPTVRAAGENFSSFQSTVLQLRTQGFVLRLVQGTLQLRVHNARLGPAALMEKVCVLKPMTFKFILTETPRAPLMLYKNHLCSYTPSVS